MRRRRRSQIQMAETIGLLFIFILLVAMGVVFWFKVKTSTISQKIGEQSELQAIEVVNIVSYLPEIQCSSTNKILENCFDWRKVTAFQDYINDPGEGSARMMSYYSLLRLSTIEIERAYPPYWDDVDADMVPDAYEGADIDINPFDVADATGNACDPPDCDGVVDDNDRYIDDGDNPTTEDPIHGWDVTHSDEVYAYDEKFRRDFDFREEWPDQDNDGILDEWEMGSFPCNGVDPDPYACLFEVRGDDMDQNGVTNWQRYVSGCEPIDSGALCLTLIGPTVITLYDRNIYDDTTYSYAASSTTVPVALYDSVERQFYFGKLMIKTYGIV